MGPGKGTGKGTRDEHSANGIKYGVAMLCSITNTCHFGLTTISNRISNQIQINSNLELVGATSS
jgi:hypothetical protein